MKSYLSLFFLFFFLFSLSFISADSEEIYAQSQEVDIKVSCLNIDCATSTEITIAYPNTTIVVNNETMTTQDSFVNYTFTDTVNLGKYKYYLVSAGGNPEFYEGEFRVTPTGIEQSSFFDNSVFLILVIISFILMLVGAHLSAPPIGFLGSILLMIVGIYTMIYGFNNYTDFYTRAVAGVILGIGFIFTMIAAYEWLPWGKRDDE